MKPLTAKQNELAQRWLVHGPVRIIAYPFYMALLSVELATHRVLDELTHRNTPNPALRDLTAIIKTFERPDRCAALVHSIRRFYPDLPIIVVDDSKCPQPLPGVTTHIMPYDSGVSAGRREGLSLVETKYVLSLDDDFLFYKRTDLRSSLMLLDQQKEVDIVGGMVIDLPLYITHDFRRDNLHKSKNSPRIPLGTVLGGLQVYDKVANFFVARTESVREINWDPALKRLDHADFFTRARGRLVTVYDPNFRVLHIRNPFNRAYLSTRLNIGGDLAYLAKKYAAPWDHC